jgi:hypothetical protein
MIDDKEEKEIKMKNNLKLARYIYIFDAVKRMISLGLGIYFLFRI